MQISIQKLQEFDALARTEAKQHKKRREIFDTLTKEEGRHFIGIVGPRGVGKTTLLKQWALKTSNSLYISLDSFVDEDIFEIAKKLSLEYGIQTLFLDEVHFLHNVDEKLKTIYDFLSIRVIFTSSVSLSMYQSAFDLSRRVRLTHLYPFSFREYVFFKTGAKLPLLTLKNIMENAIDAEYTRYAYLFDAYLQGGCMPFALNEPEPLELLRNILAKVIHRDIPSVYPLTTEELASLEKMVLFIGRAGIEGINYSSLARNIGITKYKAEQYVTILKNAFILNPAFPAGANVLYEPKVLMCLPYRLLYLEYATAIGGLREDFFAETLRMAGIQFSYLKSTRGAKTPDFLIQQNNEELVIEVGGKGKGREQFKGINLHKSLILAHTNETTDLRKPLYLLGYIA